MWKRRWMLRRTERDVCVIRILRTPSGQFAGERADPVRPASADPFHHGGPDARSSDKGLLH